MKEELNTLLIDPLKDFSAILGAFFPRLLSAVVIFFLGMILGRVFKKIVGKVLRVASADTFFDRFGIGPVLQRGGIKETPSALIARLTCWLTVIFFSIVALYTLSVPEVGVILQKLLFYLPHVFIAGLIMIAGFIISSFVETAVLIASVNAGIRFAKFIGYAVRFVIILLASTMALEQLGIGRDTVLIAFTLIFGGMIFAFALAFGLAGKEIALKFLEKKLKEDDDTDEIQHL
jgi:hypothetical protein